MAKQKSLKVGSITLSLAMMLSCSAMTALASQNGVMAVAENPVQQDDKQIVTGTVLDEFGDPIMGATVIEKGTTNGVTTDLDGNFILSVSRNASLQISFVGFTTVTLKATNNMSVTLNEDRQNLDEVVVVGMGTQKKANLTGAVAAVDSKQLGNRALTSVAAGLQGTMPGVTIKTESGRPGLDDSGTSMRVRGTGTFNTASPMVIVDGMESTMYDLDPNDIESISVLKDAASAAIYGSKAANGVLVITTKRGKAGKSSLSYAGTFGWQTPTRLTKYVNSADYAILTNEARKNDGLSELYTAQDIELFRNGTDPYGHANTDWYGLLLNSSAFQQTHNVSLQGGSDAMRYLISLGMTDQNGIIDHMSKDKYNVRMNFDTKLSAKLEGQFSMAYTREDIDSPVGPKGGYDSYFYLLTKLSPMVVNKYENGDYGYIGDGNPVAWLESNSYSQQMRNNMSAIGSLKYFILPELSVKAMATYKLYFSETHDFRKRVRYSDTYTHGDTDNLNESDYRDDRLTGDIVLEYKKTFAGKHNVYGMGGYHAELYRNRSLNGYREGFPSTSISDLDAAGTKNMSASGNTRELAMLSYYGRLTYDYAGRYLFEANLRVDGTSRFARGHRWGVFPSFSVGWRISDEAFFESIKDAVDNAKLRASWGKLGNQNIGGYYPTVSTLSLGNDYAFGGNIAQGARTAYAVNPTLEWESTTSTDIGLDLMLFNRLNITMDYYNKTTDGILMTVATPVNFALWDYYGNIGKVANNGFEFSTTYYGNIGKVNYNLGATISFNKNEIKYMGEGGDQYMNDSNGATYGIMRSGEAMNSFFGYKTAGFFKNEEEIAAAYPNGYTQFGGRDPKPGDLKYVDVNKDGKLDADDRCVLGSWEPGVTFGFNIGANYKGFDFTAVFQGATDVYGYVTREGVGYVNGDTSKPTTIWLDHWTPENQHAKTPRLIVGMEGWSMPTTTSDFWMQDATYLRLKTLQLGYSLPKKVLDKVHIANARIFYTAENLLTFTGFMDGYDPESPVGNDNMKGNIYPQIKTNSIGINVTF